MSSLALLRRAMPLPGSARGALNQPRSARRTRHRLASASQPRPSEIALSNKTSAGLRVQRMCTSCEEGPKVQAKAEHATVPPAAPDKLLAPLGSGQSIEASARTFFEGRFAQDFSGVRVHDGPAADAAAQSVGARAFTVGRDMVFRAGAYAPSSAAGRLLLAHELTHVLQQGAAKSSVSEGADAQSTGERVAGGPSNRNTSAAPTGRIQRKDDGGGVGPPDNRSAVMQNGTMKWSLVPMVGFVNARIEFTPNAAVAAASRTIAFVQTVSDSETTGGFLGLGSSASVGSTDIDKLPGESDPFYGAQRDRTANKWRDEPSSTQARSGDPRPERGSAGGGALAPREGSRPFIAGTSPSAVLNDSPMLPPVPHGGIVKHFETVATVVETGQVLGSLGWSIQRWRAGVLDDSTSTTVATVAVREGAPANFQQLMDEYYRGVVIADGFPSGGTDLTSARLDAQRVASVVQALKDPALRAVVGGAATADESDPAALSKARAETIQALLITQGAPAGSIAIDAYGADWARTQTSTPNTGPSNRRVQVTLQRA
jgi:hypothetical protein